MTAPSSERKDPRLGIALSGGGARAIAFHLGCLRALNELGLLARADVLSCTSGGSVIGALFAYSDDAFPDFEGRVRAVLRRGLMSEIVRQTLHPRVLVPATFSFVTAGVSAVVIRTLKEIARATMTALGLVAPAIARSLWDLFDCLQSPVHRPVSRTTGFANAIAHIGLGQTSLADVRRGNLKVIFNATELRTGTAFRFSSILSGGWRFGHLADNGIRVAEAVSASAAYPLFLPSLDRTYVFRTGRPDPALSGERVILSDGGIYDNLAIQSLLAAASIPGEVRHPVSHIIACDAGSGIDDDRRVRLFLVGRLKAVIFAAMRRNENLARANLMTLVNNNGLDGLLHAYLGQRDDRLTRKPSTGRWITRQDVVSYPTDFAAMSEETIDRLSARGEGLIRAVAAQYWAAGHLERLRI